MRNSELTDQTADTDQILAWRDGKPRAREPLAAAAFTAGSTAVFFILAACVMSAVVVYYQGH